MERPVNFESKVAVVTGGGSGLGRVMSELLAQRGAQVVVADINAEGANETVASILDSGGQAVASHTDITNEEQVQAMVDLATSTYGRLDIALNNAGADVPSNPIADQPVDVFNRVVAINLTGTFLCMKYQLPVMVKQGSGAIVNTSSIAGLRGHPGIGPYSAAKHGVNGLTKTAAIEYGPLGIRVNSLCPGGIRTPMLDTYFEGNPELKSLIIDNNPSRRMGEAWEMAEAGLWLASDAASYVNGHELVVDGGKLSSDV